MRRIWVLVAVVLLMPLAASAQEAPTSYPGQSNLVPPGAPTPTSAFERLTPGGSARDPSPFGWAQAGAYILPGWTDFTLRSFSATQRVATTYYSYWLDFVLPVYWGEPGHPGRTTGPTSPHYWSTEGIPAMVEALDALPRSLQIGLFYDTTILANADLTTAAGKEYFYLNVRDFYSRIPPRMWAAIDDRPVVWLYDTIWVSAFDQSSIDYLSDRFAQDFGGLRLFVVRESQWQASKGSAPDTPVVADGLYAWGAAPFGYNPSPELTIAQVGPGFKNTQYCTGGPERNCFDVDRESGTRYERQLQQAVASDRRILAVESWNEFSEGTDIQETVETGRTYIDLTRKYVDEFKARN